MKIQEATAIFRRMGLLDKNDKSKSFLIWKLFVSVSLAGKLWGSVDSGGVLVQPIIAFNRLLCIDGDDIMTCYSLIFFKLRIQFSFI